MARIEPLLQTIGISRSFGGLHAVNHVNFTLQRGEIRAIIGPNGAGKSTFVGMVCGRVHADKGKIIFKGKDITYLPAYKRIGLGMAYSFQITSIFSRLSVYENVALAARRKSAAKSDIEKQVYDCLSRTGLINQSEELAGEQSYGHQRLLEIAMGLAQDPDLFILDEPTQGLSKAEENSFKNLIRALGNEKTVLLIEHNMNVVMETADKITVLHAGEILAEGTPNEIKANREVQTAYLGKTDA